MLGKLPNNADTIENFRKEFGDILWLRVLNLTTRFCQSIKELEIVICFLMTFLNLLLKFLETRKIRASSSLEDCNNTVQLRFLKLNIENVEICCAARPVLNLI
jgi:hypothetical protein